MWRHGEIRRLRRQALNVGIEVGILSREEEITAARIQVTEETLACTCIGLAQHRTGIVKDRESEPRNFVLDR